MLILADQCLNLPKAGHLLSVDVVRRGLVHLILYPLPHKYSNQFYNICICNYQLWRITSIKN